MELSLPPDFKAGFVSLIGRPNVGKSTLLNELLGQKISITADKPQTTRNQIRGILTRPLFQAVLVDTPGIHMPQNELHKRIVNYALGSIKDSDLIFFITEPLAGGKKISKGDLTILERLEGLEKKTCLLLNKVDLYTAPQVMASIEEYNKAFSFTETFGLSALFGKGVERLESICTTYLPVSPPLYDEDTVTDTPEKVICAEFVREQIHRRLYQEVPFGVAVVVEKFVEEDKRVCIWATIFVERDAHKKILIGKGGLMLKSLGTSARQRIQTLLGTKVRLDLHVKTAKGWVDNPAKLAEFGYKIEG